MVVPLDQRPRSGPYSGLNVNSAKRFLTAQFREAGLETPDLDARLLVMAATGFSHTDMIMRGTEFPRADTFDVIADYAARRLAGEPVDHILGRREFYGREFKVTKNVLSPRPETEMLVEAALEILKEKGIAQVLDLGTGSGAIMISILAEAPQVTALAVDISETALSVAEENTKTHCVDDRCAFKQGSWFEPVSGQFDIILSNPPYITDAAMEDLAAEVTGFDPDLALRGGKDGLIAYKAIAEQAMNHLKPGGYILLEIGYDQGVSVSALLKSAGFKDVSVHQDLAGHDRMIKAVHKT